MLSESRILKTRADASRNLGRRVEYRSFWFGGEGTVAHRFIVVNDSPVHLDSDSCGAKSDRISFSFESSFCVGESARKFVQRGLFTRIARAHVPPPPQHKHHRVTVREGENAPYTYGLEGTKVEHVRV